MNEEGRGLLYCSFRCLSHHNTTVAVKKKKKKKKKPDQRQTTQSCDQSDNASLLPAQLPQTMFRLHTFWGEKQNKTKTKTKTKSQFFFTIRNTNTKKKKKKKKIPGFLINCRNTNR
jgi:hypothetical protein